MAEEPKKETEENKSSLREKISEHIKTEDVYKYAKENTLDTVAYILLVIGLILLFFTTFYGEILIGLVVGYYFSNELIDFVKNFQTFLDKEGPVKGIVLGGLLLAFFIKAPVLLITTAVLSAFRYLFLKECKKE